LLYGDGERVKDNTATIMGGQAEVR
jgi:hypothetical protein